MGLLTGGDGGGNALAGGIEVPYANPASSLSTIITSAATASITAALHFETTSSKSSSLPTSALVACTAASPNATNGYVPPGSCNSSYLAAPTSPASIVVAIIFAGLTLIHLFSAGIFRKPYCWTIIIGSLLEALAFMFRALGSKDQQNKFFAIAGNTLLLAAPICVDGFLYMTVGEMVYYFATSRKVAGIKAHRLGAYFIILDTLLLIVQGVGGVIGLRQRDSKEGVQMGTTVYVAGLCGQLLVILAFVGLVLGFQRGRKVLGRKGWMWMGWAVYVALGCITIRLAFRIVAFARGLDPAHNTLPYNETFLLAFDAGPLITAILVFAIIHPGYILVGPDSQWPNRKERKNLAAEAKTREHLALRSTMREPIGMDENARLTVSSSAMNNGGRGIGSPGSGVSPRSPWSARLPSYYWEREKRKKTESWNYL